MRRTVLVILGIAGGLVALVLIAVAIAVATVDVNSFAAPLAARVQAATGRTVTFGGPLALKLSLEPTLTAEDVSLGNAPWGRAPVLLKAGRVEAQVALLPLLHRRFEIVRIAVIDPVISLETDAQGRGNWAFGTTADAAPAPPGSALVAGPALGIAEIEVRNGTVTYRDGASGKVTPLTIETLTLQSRDASAPITGEFRGSIEGVPVALKANLGTRAALLAQQWPFPVQLAGAIAGRNATLSTKLMPRNEARQVTLDDTTLVLGGLTLQGTITIDRSGARPLYVVDVRLPRLAREALALPAVAAATGKPGTATPAPRAAATAHHVLPDEPLPLAMLATVDARGTVAIDRADLPHGQSLANVVARFTLQGGRLDLTELGAAGLGGTLSARGSLRAGADGRSALDLHVEGRELDLAAVLAVAGAPREVSGGKTRATIDLRASGASVHGWASTMDGSVLVLIGPAQLRATGKTDEALDRLGAAVNPFRDQAGGTALKCGVIRLPLQDGVARVERSIAIETAELGVSATGTIDFRNETLDLGLRPQLRQGIPLDVAQIAGLVRVQGPFEKPQIAVDPAKSAEAIARIGAAIGTGGWSLLGETLFNAAAGKDSPCAVALGAKPAAAAAAGNAANAAAPSPPVQEIGNAIRRLFGR